MMRHLSLVLLCAGFTLNTWGYSWSHLRSGLYFIQVFFHLNSVIQKDSGLPMVIFLLSWAGENTSKTGLWVCSVPFHVGSSAWRCNAKPAHFRDSNDQSHKGINPYKSHKAFRIEPHIPQTIIVRRPQWNYGNLYWLRMSCKIRD